MYDPDKQDELVDKARRMVGPRMCAACFVAEDDQRRYHDGGGDVKGRHWTFEGPA